MKTINIFFSMPLALMLFACGSGSSSDLDFADTSQDSPEPQVTPEPQVPEVSPECTADTQQLPVLESKTIVEHQAKSGWFTDHWSTPLTSKDDHIFYVYVDPDLQPIVGKISESKKQTFFLEEGYITEDDGHNEYSIATDKQGFIHILGNMHNHEFRYWRSDYPEDPSSFSRYFGEIEGMGFTYYGFRKDNNGELYIAARAQALDKYYVKGGRAIGLYHYDMQNSGWTALGEKVPHESAKYPVVFWENSGQDGGSYQIHKTDLAFDVDNNLHFASALNLEDSPIRENAVVYAWSENVGKTFRSVGTKELAPPLSISSTDSLIPPVAYTPGIPVGEYGSILLSDSIRVGLVYSQDNSTQLVSRANLESDWSEPKIVFDSNCQRCFAAFDKTRKLGFVTDGIKFSWFDACHNKIGQTTSSVRISRWDRSSIANDGVYRGVFWDSKTGEWKLIDLYFQ